MKKRKIERTTDLVQRLFEHCLNSRKRIKELEMQRYDVWIDAKEISPKQGPIALPFWAAIRIGGVTTRVGLVVWTEDGFRETTNIYAQDLNEYIREEDITHWMPMQRPLYPAKL